MNGRRIHLGAWDIVTQVALKKTDGVGMWAGGDVMALSAVQRTGGDCLRDCAVPDPERV
jgi:hypothetical protein